MDVVYVSHRRRCRAHERGATLVEVLIAAFVLLMAVGAILETYNQFSRLGETTKDNMTALRDAQSMMERISSTAFANIEATYPNGAVDGGGVTDYSAIVGGYSLTNEQITVTYPAPGSNPLEMIVTVQWNTAQGRPMTKSLSTIRAN